MHLNFLCPFTSVYLSFAVFSIIFPFFRASIQIESILFVYGWLNVNMTANEHMFVVFFVTFESFAFLCPFLFEFFFFIGFFSFGSSGNLSVYVVSFYSMQSHFFLLNLSFLFRRNGWLRILTVHDSN